LFSGSKGWRPRSDYSGVRYERLLLQQIFMAATESSMITSKAATNDRPKTGHHEVTETGSV
jgi:hypothetical protein